MKKITDLRLTEWSLEDLAALEVAVQEAQRWKGWESIDRNAARRAQWAHDQWLREQDVRAERKAILEQAYAEQATQELPTQRGTVEKRPVVRATTWDSTAPVLAIEKVTIQEDTAKRLPASEVATVKTCITKVTPSKLYPRNADVFINVPQEFFSEGILEHPAITGLFLSGDQRRFSGRLEYLTNGKPETETVRQLAARVKWKNTAVRV